MEHSHGAATINFWRAFHMGLVDASLECCVFWCETRGDVEPWETVQVEGVRVGSINAAQTAHPNTTNASLSLSPPN